MINVLTRNIDRNLLDYNNWSGLTTGDIGYYNDYAIQSVNRRIVGGDPFGNSSYLWMVSGLTSGSTGIYGGFNMLNGQFMYIPVDNTKNYRFSMWVNRKIVNTTTPGDTYFGLFGTSGTTYQYIRNKQTSALTVNPYFVVISPAISLTHLPQDNWRLLVGYLYNKDYSTGSTIDGGLYYMNGARISGTSAGVYTYDFIMSSLVTGVTMRVSCPYNAGSGTTSQFAYPRIDCIDGTEPSIYYLLHNEGPKQEVLVHTTDQVIMYNDCRSEAFNVGDYIDGGVVAYIFVLGDTGYVSGKKSGIIVSIDDLFTGITFGSYGTNVTGTTIVYSKGLFNDNLFITQFSGETLARIITGTTIAGYYDWCIGTLYDMRKVATNRSSLPNIVESVGYWTSSQASATEMSVVYTLGVYADMNQSKDSSFRVRPVRYFSITQC